MLTQMRKACRMLKGKSKVLSVKEELVGYKTVLDIGCGDSSLIRSFSKSLHSVGIDIFKPALIKSRKARIHDDYVLAEINHLCFKPKSFEAVLALDVLEHLKKIDGHSFLENIEKIARDVVVIVTPNGFLHQTEYDGNAYQIHISGWTAKELKRIGFQVSGIDGLKFLRKEKGEFRFQPEMLFYEVTAVSQKLAYHFPNLAFSLLCVKKLHK